MQVQYFQQMNKLGQEGSFQLVDQVKDIWLLEF